jgi:hypothetical protein
VGLGIALAVFFAGITSAVAVGATPPTALWAAGGAVSGALVGLLAPAPGSRRRHEAAAKAAEDIAKQASSESQTHLSQVKPEAADAASFQARADAETARAEKATSEATAHRVAAATTPETKFAAAALAVVFVLLLVLVIVLAAGTIVPPTQFTESLKSVITAVMALASASGTALLGILSPSKGG